MRMLSVQELFCRKLARQETIPGLEFHASGHCVHVGKLSPGCRRRAFVRPVPRASPLTFI